MYISFKYILKFSGVGLIIILFTTLTTLTVLYQPWVTPLSSAPRQASAQRLEKDVRYLSQTLYPRSADRIDNLNTAANYINSEFQFNGAAVNVQDVPMAGGPYKNIIARFGPQQGPVIIIGAHYDVAAALEHAGLITTPGAEDNASGVAGLLELARLLKQRAPGIGVELVAYASEEPPFFRSDEMGSAVHATALSRPVKLMVALEMIGYYDSNPGSQGYPWPALSAIYPDRGDFIAVVGRLQDISVARRVKSALLSVPDLAVYSINAPAFLPGIDFSDHMNYWRQGISAVMITDTAFYRNPEYHQPGDTADRLDYEKMAQVVDGVFRLVMNDER